MSMSAPLSYKKPSQKKVVETSSPRLSDVSTPPASPRLNVPEGTRKISNRRKALQEFYHLQNQRKGDTQEEHEAIVPTTPRKESVSDKIDFQDPQQYREYIRNTDIQEILRLRNKITNNLNSHESEKKSIIYDNYYELIKLNDTLKSLYRPNPKEPNDLLNNLNKPSNSEKLDQTAMLKTLEDLKNFMESKSKIYRNDFSGVLNNLVKNYKGSVNGATDELIPQSIDKKQLITEINTLLLDPKNIFDSQKEHLSKQIDRVLPKLNPENDELLIFQLKSVRESYRT